jgi:radical SAM protein with 4Fe4S-binding SPASM domain
VFDWQGNAQMCCIDIKSELQLGNIHDKSIYEIFNSQKAKEVRKSLLNKQGFNLEPCKSCSSFESYKNYKAPWGS